MNLDERTLRLIAVGASVSANCQSCLQANVETAMKAGIQEQDIAEAIHVGKIVRQGAASKMDRFAAGLSSIPQAPEKVAESGCGCNSPTQWTQSPNLC